MYTIFKDFNFAAAHRIRGHTGGCENVHGHNYKVRVYVQAEELDELGMVIDFSDLKALLAEILGPFDHRLINEIPPFDRRNTTAELLSEYVYRQVEERLTEERIWVSRVEVWESDSCCAAFQARP